jgi:hypothetical protein
MPEPAAPRLGTTSTRPRPSAGGPTLRRRNHAAARITARPGESPSLTRERTESREAAA